MEEFVKNSTKILASGAELLAALIIAYGLLRAVVEFIRNVAGNKGNQVIPKAEIRLAFGRSLVLALEFLLAADILQTAVAPTWDEIGKLAAIAALRTVLNYFLEKELKKLKQE